MKLCRSLRTRLLMPLVAALLVLCGLAIYNAFIARAQETQQTQMTALRLARHIAIDQAQHIENTRQLLTLLAKFTGDKLSAGGLSCDRTLAETRLNHTQYANIGVITLDGRVLCSALPFSEGIRLDKRKYFQRTLNSRGFAVGDYQIGLITGRGSLNAGYPLLDGSGNIEAILFAALDLGWISQSLSKIPLPKDTITSLVAGDGTILARYPDDGLTGKPFGQGYNLPPLSVTEESTGNFTDADGDVRLFALAPIPDWNGESPRVIVSISEEVAYGETNTLFIRQIIGLLVISLLAAGLAWFWAKHLILTPIELLTAASRGLSSGNLKARVGLTPPVREMAQLANSFDGMADSLEERYHKIEQQDAELLRTNRALQTLSAGNHTLLRAIDEQQLLEEMCHAAVDISGYRLAWVGYTQEDKAKTILPMAQAGLSTHFPQELPFSWGETIAGRTSAGLSIRSAKTVVARKLQTHPTDSLWLEFFQQFGLHSSICLPLVVSSQVIGLFTIYSEEEEAFDTREQAILEEMSQDLAFGIQTLRTRIKKEEAEQRIHHLAYHDPLTDLPNYRQLDAWLTTYLESSRNENPRLALLNIGLDRLREINVSLGFKIGNQILKETASEISQLLSGDEKLARLQSDEIAVFTPNAGVHDAETRATEIIAVINKQHHLVDGFTLAINARAGIVLYPDHGTTTIELIQQAGTALQLARDNKVDYAFYSPKEDKERKYLLGLAGKLHHALENEELELFYQPKICMDSSRILGFEALARWHHPEDGMIAPDVFIKVAENTGMIHRLSRWALEKALRQLSSWAQLDIHLPVAVNLSALDIHNSKLIEFIEETVARYQLEQGMLEIEITESAIIEDPENALLQLTRLRAMGIALYIDDFGTGFSSLASLNKLPFNAIKIDKSFVIDMLKDPDAGIIVHSTIVLAHELGLSVVAEGVETEEIWTELKKLGCNAAQGYFMAKPMAATAVEKWLDESIWEV